MGVGKSQFAGAAALAAFSAAAPALAQDCDRDCLIGVTDAYIAALVAHDPSAAPLAENVAFVENVTRMQPGEGLWASATGGTTDFTIYVPDVVLQQVGFLGMMEREDMPVMLALRLKLGADGKIAEAEHLSSRPPEATSSAS
jgi:hypothetical protein